MMMGIHLPTSVYHSPGNLPMLCILATQTLNLILLDAAARAKHGEIVGCQSSDVARHSFSVLCASGQIEKYHIKGCKLQHP
jgi:hypothetical protein